MRTILIADDNPADRTTIGSTSIDAMYRDRNGVVWIGTFGSGISTWSPCTERMRRYVPDVTDPQSLPKQHVSAVFEDGAGLLWLGCHQGLARFDPESDRFTRYSLDSLGLADTRPTITTFCEDATGQLWFGCNAGVYVIGKDGNLIASYQHDPGSGQIVHLGQGHGFGYNSHDRGSGAKARNGNLFFGGGNGLDCIYSERIQFDTSPPPVAITGVSLFHREVPVGQMADGRTLLDKHVAYADQLTLNHDDNVLSLDFAVLHYGAPEKNQYSVMMEGLERDWRYPGNQRTAHYPNMPPGEYVFRVKGANNDGAWNEEGASLGITILPPFAEKMGKPIDRIARKGLESLKQYPWPGNVRELRSLVERAMIQAKGRTLEIHAPARPSDPTGERRPLREVEREHIVKVLERTGWRVRGKGGAAEALGLKPTTLEARMKKLGIRRPT